MFSRFGPYHVARLEAAGGFFRQKGVEIVGIEIAGSDSTYAWERTEGATDFRRVALFESMAFQDVPRGNIRRAVRDVLEIERPEAVALPGWSNPGALAGLAWCNRNGACAILMSETSRHDFRRRWWREQLKKRIVKRFNAALVGGGTQAEYARELGVDPGRIFTGYDAVDNAYFTSGAGSARADAGVLRKRYGLPSSYFLASGRFVPKKNLTVLLDAFAQYRNTAGNDAWDLVLCGDGPMKAELLSRTERLGLGDAVLMPGFIQYDELPVYYGLAKAFVHVSTTEQWGLVVNEAMASGLPVIVSDRCGCAPELVESGVNGFIVDPCDVRAVAGLMAGFAGGDQDLQAMGGRSRRIVDKCSPEAFARGLWQAAVSGDRIGSCHE